MDVLKKGQIRGRCKLDNSTLKAEAVHISPLQSWGPEIQHFQETTSQINRKSKFCDVYVERPTFIMKIDASKCLSKFKITQYSAMFACSCKYVPPLL